MVFTVLEQKYTKNLKIEITVSIFSVLSNSTGHDFIEKYNCKDRQVTSDGMLSNFWPVPANKNLIGVALGSFIDSARDQI